MRGITNVSGSLTSYGAPLAIGADTESDSFAYFFEGLIDELNISDVVRSADWISASYININSPTTFVQIGSQQGSATPELN